MLVSRIDFIISYCSILRLFSCVETLGFTSTFAIASILLSSRFHISYYLDVCEVRDPKLKRRCGNLSKYRYEYRDRFEYILTAKYSDIRLMLFKVWIGSNFKRILCFFKWIVTIQHILLFWKFSNMSLFNTSFKMSKSIIKNQTYQLKLHDPSKNMK